MIRDAGRTSVHRFVFSRLQASRVAAAFVVVITHEAWAEGAEPPPAAPSGSASGSDAASTPAKAQANGKGSAPAVAPNESAANDALARIIDRPHTIAELEAGIIALPNAPISPGQRGGDAFIFGKIGRGDATVQTGIHVLYRWSREYAVGAGAIFAPSPTSDEQYGGLSSLPRTHARSYLFLGMEGRYIPVHYKYFEAWVGLSSGAVIVADRFTTQAGDEVPTILGTRDVTIRTEGFAIGAQLGCTYYITENWLAGANLRGYHWILPENRQCSSIGDCATLSGSVQAFEMGLTIGYRLPL
jgi:hypothetical protein